MQPFFLHPAAAAAILDGTIDLDTDAMYCALFAAALTPSLAMVDYGDMSANEIVDADYARVALSGQAIITDGNLRAFDCADISFGTTVSIEAKLMAIFVGTAATPQATDLLLGWALLNAGAVKDITAVTAANPAVATSAGHGFSNSDSIMVQGVDMLDSLGTVIGIHSAANVATDTFDLGTLDLSSAALAGRTGKATKLNSTLTAQSVSSVFSITIPSNGLFAI